MTHKAQIKKLRQELHYFQTMVRVDLRALMAGIQKCKEIGKKMRELQKNQANSRT